MDDSQGRPLNVSLLAGSGAHRAYYDRSGSSVSELTADELAAGFPPRPALNLRFFGGRTIADLVFANHYLGGPPPGKRPISPASTRPWPRR